MTLGRRESDSDGGTRRAFGVGIIGLGRLWELRHRPALDRLADRFVIRGIYDQVPARATREAGRLGVSAHESFTSLIERPDVDVLMILAAPWHGLECVHVAAEHRKAVYSSVPLATEPPDRLAMLERVVTESGILFVPEFARRCYPASIALRELVRTTLGPVRFLRCEARLFGFDRNAAPGPSSQLAPVPILVDPGSYLIDWCRFLIDDDPVAIQGQAEAADGSRRGDRDFESFALTFSRGAVARVDIVRFPTPNGGEAWRFLPPAGLQVHAENGIAWVEPPDRICWSVGGTNHEERLAIEPPIGEVLCSRLHRTLSGEPNVSPTWSDAMLAARWIRRLIDR